MNAEQMTTGAVHKARLISPRDLPYRGAKIPENMYAAACQAPGKARYWLSKTDKPVTCKRCTAKYGE
jgi:hypothetical protein